MKDHFIPPVPIAVLLTLQAFILFLVTSCVSIEVPFRPTTKAEKATVTPPSANFIAFKSSTADESWISEKTGNTISYLSECKKSDESIADVARETANVIDQLKILKSSSGTIDSKTTAELIVAGLAEAQKVKMSLAVFRHKDCTYSLTYGGLEKNFESELGEFETFKKGFRTP